MALAIALGHEPPHHDDPPEGPDSFLADHGFEYIDGERTRHLEKMALASASEENGEDSDDEDDVQGLSRVVDALSTIMWPTMVRKQANNDRSSGKQKNELLRPSLFDFDGDDDDVLLADDDEETTLAALMEADAVEQGAPQTRASRMRKEMQALERWLVENEELHEKELGGSDDVDDNDDEDEDEGEDEDHEHDSSGDVPPPSLQVSASAAPSMQATSIDDPWAASTSITSNPTSMSAQSTTLTSHSTSITTSRTSGFDDDFSAFVSAPAMSIVGDSVPAAKTTTGTVTAASTSASASGIEPIADARRLHTQTQLLLPSHTGGSIRSIRSARSDLSISDVGDDLGGGAGYEALDDISSSSLNFSPEHGDVDGIDDGGPHTSIRGRRSGDRAASLGDVPFDLPNILSALQTVREDVAEIEDEAERRATTARFASEFVFERMGEDGDERGETEG